MADLNIKLRNRSIVKIVIFLLSTVALHGQLDQSFEVRVSTDTVLAGTTFEIRFEAKNLSGTFEPPTFHDFDLVGGPSQSTQMSFVNGVSNQSSSYSYFLMPKEVGVHTLEPAYYITNDTSWETSPIDIYCLPNPEGIRNDTRIDSKGNADFPSWFGRDRYRQPAVKKKKKLKETKI